MNPASSKPMLRFYRVRLGHAEVRVQGESAQDAVRHARRQLCRDLPRLWDVIQSLDDNRFQVAIEED